MKQEPIAADPLEASVRDQAVDNLAAQVTKSQDGLIASVITAAIGGDWTLLSLAGRLVRKVYPDKVEVLSLDGNDILELRPMQFVRVTEGDSIKIKAVQGYRLLRSDGKGLNFSLSRSARCHCR